MTSRPGMITQVFLTDKQGRFCFPLPFAITDKRGVVFHSFRSRLPGSPGTMFIPENRIVCQAK